VIVPANACWHLSINEFKNPPEASVIPCVVIPSPENEPSGNPIPIVLIKAHRVVVSSSSLLNSAVTDCKSHSFVFVIGTTVSPVTGVHVAVPSATKKYPESVDIC